MDGEQPPIQYVQMPTTRQLPRQLTSSFEIAGLLASVKAKVAEKKDMEPVIEKSGEKVIKAVQKMTPFSEIFDEDMTTSYLSPVEHALVRTHVNLNNFTMFVAERIGKDLSHAQNFYTNALKGVLISSKGKGGFVARLAKTDVAITEESLHQYEHAQLEEKKKSFWSKFGLGGNK